MKLRELLAHYGTYADRSLRQSVEADPANDLAGRGRYLVCPMYSAIRANQNSPERGFDMGFAIANDLIAEFERWALSAGFDISKNGIVQQHQPAALVGFSAGRDRRAQRRLSSRLSVAQAASSAATFPRSSQMLKRSLISAVLLMKANAVSRSMRTKLFSSRVFACEAAALVLFPAVRHLPTASASDYAGLNNLILDNRKDEPLLRLTASPVVETRT